MMEPHTKVVLTNEDRYAQNHSTFFIVVFNFVYLIFFPEAFYASVKKIHFCMGIIIKSGVRVNSRGFYSVAEPL